MKWKVHVQHSPTDVNNQTPTALGLETTETVVPTTNKITEDTSSNLSTNLDTDGITKTDASTQTVLSNTGDFITNKRYTFFSFYAIYTVAKRSREE